MNCRYFEALDRDIGGYRKKRCVKGSRMCESDCCKDGRGCRRCGRGRQVKQEGIASKAKNIARNATLAMLS